MAAGQLTAMLLKSLKPSTRLNQRLPMAAQRFLVQQAAPQNLLQLARASRSHFHTTQAPSYVGASRSGLLRRTFASTPEPVTTATTLSVSSDADEPLVTDAPNFDAAAAEAQPSVVEVVSVTTEPPPQAATPEEPLLQPEPAASSEAVVSADPSLSNFLQSWKVYTEALATQGFFRDEVFDLSSTEVEQYGIVKRANLNMARERPDLLYSLPEAKIVNLISQPLPYSERKIDNAYTRLSATYLEKDDLDAGRGGVATSQDLARLVIGAYYSIRLARKHERHQQLSPTLHQAGFLNAVAAIIPDIVSLLALPPDPEAVAKSESALKLKEQQAFTPAGTRVPFKAVRRDDNMGRRERRGPPGDGARVHTPRPGEWDCDVCGQHNFAQRMECYRCSAERPASAGPPPQMESRSRPGDWTCPDCGNSNFARRMDCNRCSMPRPPETLPVGGGARPPPLGDEGRRYQSRYTDAAPSGVKQGDWFCPECDAHNFASRSECFQCTAPRPASAGAAPLPDTDRRYSPRRTDSAPSGMKAGDWFCSDCGAHNFASRKECFQCGIAKSEVAERYRGEGFGGRVHPGRDDFGRRESSPRGGGGGGGRDRRHMGSRPDRSQGLDKASADDWFNSS